MSGCRRVCFSALPVTTGSRGTTENLAPANASKAEVWLAYEKVVEGRKKLLTFQQLWKKFLNSADYADLAPGHKRLHGT